MALKDFPGIDDSFIYRPFPIGDPGPEIYSIYKNLPEEKQQLVAAALTEAVAKIAAVKGQAYSQIGGIVAGRQQE